MTEIYMALYAVAILKQRLMTSVSRGSCLWVFRRNMQGYW